MEGSPPQAPLTGAKPTNLPEAGRGRGSGWHRQPPPPRPATEPHGQDAPGLGLEGRMGLPCAFGPGLSSISAVPSLPPSLPAPPVQGVCLLLGVTRVQRACGVAARQRLIPAALRLARPSRHQREAQRYVVKASPKGSTHTS